MRKGDELSVKNLKSCLSSNADCICLGLEWMWLMVTIFLVGYPRGSGGCCDLTKPDQPDRKRAIQAALRIWESDGFHQMALCEKVFSSREECVLNKQKGPFS